MSIKEAERFRLLKNHAEGTITIREISNLLNISYRHARRLYQSFKAHGEKGVISKKKGNRNHSLGEDLKEKIMTLIKENYSDYGPTLAQEKLSENHKIDVSRETIRKIMIEKEIWEVKRKKQAKAYQRRTRRSSIGDLVQIDGSPHYWFEKRGVYCTLLVAVDDATGRICSTRFEEEETTNGYFHLLKDYLKKYGKPNSLYTDKYGVFRVNQGKNRSKPTQFARAMKELDIQIINAETPQAKGRVERANRVLQDRLVKELREANISTIEEGNEFLKSYIEKHNERFEKKPASSKNAHRKLEERDNLEETLCYKEDRKISKNLEIQYKNEIYQIDAPNRVNRLRGVSVKMIEKMNGEVLIEYKGELLKYNLYQDFHKQPPVADFKEIAFL